MTACGSTLQASGVLVETGEEIVLERDRDQARRLGGGRHGQNPGQRGGREQARMNPVSPLR